MSAPRAPRDLRALPKGHLHLHLQLGMRPATLVDLAEHYGVEAPPTQGFSDFAGFQRIIDGVLTVLRAPADFERLVAEVVEDAALDGCAYLEPSFYPAVHRDVCGTDEAMWELVLAAGEEAGRRHGVTVRWMAAVDRVLDTPQQAVEFTRLAVRYKDDGIVSLGLHNDEAGRPPEPYAEAFRLAKDAGLLSTPHAGELEGPASVRGALDVLHADRLQHGIRSVEDPELLRELAERGTCLDVCPSSNVMLGVVPDLASHPLPALLDAGVRCSINADDPICFGPGVLEEYELCRSAFHLDDEALAAVARTSLTSGALPDAHLATALSAVDTWLAAPA